MKTLTLILALVTTSVFAAKPQARKVSSSHYYVCFLEREAGDHRDFKREYRFPYPTDKGETYELKGSMRWNKYSAIFSQTGEVEIRIEEEGKIAEKSHQLGKDPHFASMDVKVNKYRLQCSPE